MSDRDHHPSRTPSSDDRIVEPGLAEAVERVAQDHDDPAWATIHHRAGERIRSVALRLSGHHDLADDVVQETLLTIREHASDFHPRGADANADAAAWIMRIAANATVSAMRRLRRQRARDLRYAMLRPEWSDDPEVDLDRTEWQAALRDQLSQLPSQQRTVLILHHLCGMTFGAIALELALPIGTAKTHAHRGLEALRERLSRHAPALALIDVVSQLSNLSTPSAPRPGEAVLSNPFHLLRTPTVFAKGLPMLKAVAVAVGILTPLTFGAAHLLAQDAAPARLAAASADRVTVTNVAADGTVSLRDRNSGITMTVSPDDAQFLVQVNGGAWKPFSSLAVGDYVIQAGSEPLLNMTAPPPTSWGTVVSIDTGVANIKDHESGLVYPLRIPVLGKGESVAIQMVDGTMKAPSSLLVGDRIRTDLQRSNHLPTGAKAVTGTVTANDGTTVVLRCTDGSTTSLPITAASGPFDSWTVGSTQTFYQLPPPPKTEDAVVVSNDGTSVILKLVDGSHETVPIPSGPGEELKDWAPGDTVHLSPHGSGQRMERVMTKSAQ